MIKYDTRIISQISPSGFNKEGKLIGPSKVYNTFYKQEIIELSKEEILSIEDEVAKGALIAKKSGFDGINFPVAHWDFLVYFYLLIIIKEKMNMVVHLKIEQEL